MYLLVKGVLTKYIDGDCTVNWTWNPIVCNTAVCPTISPVDIYNMPGISNKQHFILWHSGPGDVWVWFTSCIAKQRQIRTFIHSLVITIRSHPWWNWKERIWQCMALVQTHYCNKKLLIVTLILKHSGKQLQYIYFVLCNSSCIQCSYYVFYLYFASSRLYIMLITQ